MTFVLHFPGRKNLPYYMHVPYDEADLNALQAVADGRADSDQQKRVVEWLVKRGTKYDEVSHQPDDERGSAFAEGRRFVGAAIMTLLNRSAFDLRKSQTRTGA